MPIEESTLINQAAAAKEIEVLARPRHFLDEENNRTEQIFEKDFKQRKFLILGLESWLKKKYGPESPELKPIMKLFALLQNKYNTFRTVLTPEATHGLYSKTRDSFQTSRLVAQGDSTRTVKNIGTVVFENLQFRIGVLEVETSANTKRSERVKFANCEIDHLVWNFFKLLYPQKMYARTVLTNIETYEPLSAEASLELAKRVSRSVLPQELIMMLNAIELGNHDFTVHALFDDSDISPKAKTIKEDYGISNSGISSKINQIDGTVINNPPLSSRPNLDGKYSRMNIYEVVAFHLNAMAWKEVFSKKPEGDKIKRALLNQILMLHKKLVGDSPESVLSRAKASDAIAAQFSEEEIYEILSYVKKVHLNFICNIIDPKDPELKLACDSIGLALPNSEKHLLIHKENLLELIQLDMSQLLNDFQSRLESAKDSIEKSRLVDHVTELIDEADKGGAETKKQLLELLPQVELLAKTTKKHREISLLIRVLFALGNEQEAITIAVDAIVNNASADTNRTKLIDIFFNTINTTTLVANDRCFTFLMQLARGLQPKVGSGEITQLELESLFRQAIFWAGSYNYGIAFAELEDAYFERSTHTELDKLRLKLGQMGNYLHIATAKDVLPLLAQIENRYKNSQTKEPLLDSINTCEDLVVYAEMLYKLQEYSAAYFVAQFTTRAISPNANRNKNCSIQLEHFLPKLYRLSNKSKKKVRENTSNQDTVTSSILET